MFSSISAFFFGVPANVNNQTDQNPPRETQNEQQDPQNPTNEQQADEQAKERQKGERHVRIDDERTFSITQLTPSVTGGDIASGVQPLNGKKKRSKCNKQARRRCSPPTSDSESLDEEWCIIENRGDAGSEKEFASRTPSPIAPLPPQKTSLKPKKSKRSRKSQNQQQLKVQQRQQFAYANTKSSTAAEATTQDQQQQPQEQAECISDENATASLYPAGPEAPHNVSGDSTNSDGSALSANGFMEESWFVTPPPCFTSTGPGQVEVTPYENLFIEHPSKSVYLSIRAEQEVADCLEDLDLGVDESQHERVQQCQQLHTPMQPEAETEESLKSQQLHELLESQMDLSSEPELQLQEQSQTQQSETRAEESLEQWSEPESDCRPEASLEQWSERPNSQQSVESFEPSAESPVMFVDAVTVSLPVQPSITNTQVVVEHAERPLLNHYSLVQLKQELLALYGQKIHAKKERQSLARGALKRANQARDFQSRGNTQRRSDMQHCRVKSYVNNNRKCGYVKC